MEKISVRSKYIVNENVSAEIHQALLSQFSLLAEFFIGKLPIED